VCALIRVKDEKWREKNFGGPPPYKKNKKIEKSELSEMARTLIKKIRFCFSPYDDVDDDVDDDNDVDIDDDHINDVDGSLGLGGGGVRVLACADTLARTPLGVRQY
jgi:hypothetical protein